MRFAVVGAGGVGGYFGARLAAAGHDVAFVARGEHLSAIRRDGLRVESIKGDVHIRPARATDRPEEIGPVDAVLCAVKAWQLTEALRAMPPLLGQDTVVLPLQNGVEAVDAARKALGRERVLGGAAWIRAEIAAPGLIRHSGIEPRIVLGEPDGGESGRARDLAAVLSAAGVSAEATADIVAVLWSKLVFISATSAVGAVARISIDAYRAVPETRALLVAAMEETMAVARGRGVALAPDVLERTLAFVDSLPAGTTSSMQRDVMAGRPSELDAQCGAVARLGREAGVPTPVNDFLYAALLPQERAARQAAGRAG
jgi:2-dehydropantoate 2-reductase